jgi:hypothetical protein
MKRDMRTIEARPMRIDDAIIGFTRVVDALLYTPEKGCPGNVFSMCSFFRNADLFNFWSRMDRRSGHAI